MVELSVSGSAECWARRRLCSSKTAASKDEQLAAPLLPQVTVGECCCGSCGTCTHPELKDCCLKEPSTVIMWDRFNSLLRPTRHYTIAYAGCRSLFWTTLLTLIGRRSRRLVWLLLLLKWLSLINQATGKCNARTATATLWLIAKLRTLTRRHSCRQPNEDWSGQAGVKRDFMLPSRARMSSIGFKNWRGFTVAKMADSEKSQLSMKSFPVGILPNLSLIVISLMCNRKEIIFFFIPNYLFASTKIALTLRLSQRQHQSLLR